MSGRKNSQSQNAWIRNHASTALFPILVDLGVQAALTHKGAAALHQDNYYIDPKKLRVVIAFEPGVVLQNVLEEVIRRNPFFRQTGSDRLNYSVEHSRMKKLKCKVYFTLSGGQFPRVLESFDDVEYIASTPVLPMHAILLAEVLDRAWLDGSAVKDGARFIQRCLDAVGRIQLSQFSALWSSSQAIRGIRRHVMEMPHAKEQWVLLGIDPEIFNLATPVNQHVEVRTDVLPGPPEGTSEAHQVNRSQPPLRGPIYIGTVPLVGYGSTSFLSRPPPQGNTVLHIDNIQATQAPTLPSTRTPGSAPRHLVPPATSVDHNQQTPIHAAATRAVPARNVKLDLTVSKFIARVVIGVLQELDLECAIFGSTACQLYGNTRVPGDLDVLILPDASFSQDAEWIKFQLIKRRPTLFKLTPGKSPGATYHVLFFTLSGYANPIVSRPSTSSRMNHRQGRTSKVDILLPGIMHLPRLTSNDIVWKEGLPVVPFLTLLLQKLQGWGDHLESSEPHKHRKHAVDAQDIAGLLSLSKNLPLTASRPWRERALMSDEFQADSSDRIKKFCGIFPVTKQTWDALGFEVE